MVRRIGFAIALPALLAAGVAPADDAVEIRWSLSPELVLEDIASEEADDELTGFFDQYRYTPNKSSDVPAQLGLRDASLDLMGEEETPWLQLRLQSPSSNVGIGGPDDQGPFLNQRIDLLSRRHGALIDFGYRRFRTDELRLFPDASDIPFIDHTEKDDRFFHKRTGFGGSLRLRLHQTWSDVEALSWLAPELAIRGSFQERKGERQNRFRSPETGEWLGTDQDIDQEVEKLGGGVAFSPGGWFTIAFDADHERFREDASTLVDADLDPGTMSSTTIGFVPDTDRTTASVRIRSRLGGVGVLSGGYQFTRLEQVHGLTPAQRQNGLRDNELLYHSANLAADFPLGERISFNATAKYDQRHNDIDRGTPLFNDSGGTQVAEFLERLRRWNAGAELVYRPAAANLLALGVRGEWIERELDFVPDLGAGLQRRILRKNALVSEDTQIYTVYGRAVLRPLRGLSLRGELGYREAPRTGYIVELDDHLYGKLRASYVLPVPRPVVISAFAQGESGENRDFTMVDGRIVADGPRTDRDFDRAGYRAGVTLSAVPCERASLFASFFYSRDAQDYDLVLSDRARYLQDAAPVSFSADDDIDYRSVGLNALAGTQLRLGERTELGTSYGYTRVDTHYRTRGTFTESLREASRIVSDIHRVGAKLQHRVTDGLRLNAGYRFAYYDDDARMPTGQDSVVRPVDHGTFRHTLTLGVTLSSELLD